MTARLLQLTTLCSLALAAGWFLSFYSRGASLLAWCGAAGVLFGYAAVLGVEFLLVAVTDRGGLLPAPTASQLLRAWAAEVLLAPRVFCWRQAFFSRSIPDSLPSPADRSCPAAGAVLLVHGFACNRGFWNPWMTKLRERHVAYVAVNLEPPFASIDRYVPTIEAAARKLHLATGRPLVIVAHSMGGLAVRAWLAQTELATQVSRVITIGTPHGGTWIARLALARNAAEMRPGARWQSELGRRESDGLRAPVTCFFSNCDNVVVPASSGMLAGAENRHIGGLAHVELAFDDKVFDEALRSMALPHVTPDQPGVSR